MGATRKRRHKQKRGSRKTGTQVVSPPSFTFESLKKFPTRRKMRRAIDYLDWRLRTSSKFKHNQVFISILVNVEAKWFMGKDAVYLYCDDDATWGNIVSCIKAEVYTRWNFRSRGKNDWKKIAFVWQKRSIKRIHFVSPYEIEILDTNGDRYGHQEVEPLDDLTDPSLLFGRGRRKDTERVVKVFTFDPRRDSGGSTAAGPQEEMLIADELRDLVEQTVRGFSEVDQLIIREMFLKERQDRLTQKEFLKLLKKKTRGAVSRSQSWLSGRIKYLRDRLRREIRRAANE